MEFNIVDKRREEGALQVGDWVTVTDRSNDPKGYVERINGHNVQIHFTYPEERIRVIDSDRVVRLTSQPENRDIDTLIDLALDMEDKEWFEQLCKQKNAETTK